MRSCSSCGIPGPVSFTDTMMKSPLSTAVIVMLGQIPIGIYLTHALPHALHIEAIRNWILTITNSAASRAIAFGIGIGSLAVALRIWLGLERGSYFDN